MTVQLRLATPEEEAALAEKLLDTPTDRDPHFRFQCSCGRFAKSGVAPRQDFFGEWEWSVICKAHGEVWMN